MKRTKRQKPKAKTKLKARTSGRSVSGTDPCVCGHAPEEHGRDAAYPGSTSCTECDCIAYEADPEDGPT